MARATLILLLAALLGACGFQLRGAVSATGLPADWRQLHLETSSLNSEFTRELRARFAANGIEWVDRQQAAYILQLQPERFSQRNLSLTREARAAEFELTLQTQFTVRAPDGTIAMQPSDAVVTQQMENDPSNVVGKAEEIRILQAEMRGELAQQILRRIGFHAAAQ